MRTSAIRTSGPSSDSRVGEGRSSHVRQFPLRQPSAGEPVLSALTLRPANLRARNAAKKPTARDRGNLTTLLHSVVIASRIIMTVMTTKSVTVTPQPPPRDISPTRTPSVDVSAPSQQGQERCCRRPDGPLWHGGRDPVDDGGDTHDRGHPGEKPLPHWDRRARAHDSPGHPRVEHGCPGADGPEVGRQHTGVAATVTGSTPRCSCRQR